MTGDEYTIIGGQKKYFRKKKVHRKRFGRTPTPLKPTTTAWHLELIRQVRVERLKQGLSQAALAHSVGSNQAAISKFETGLANPSVQFITTLSEQLKVSITIRVDLK